MRQSEDFDAEIRAHIEIETDRLIAEGVSPAEAASQARRTFGNLTHAQETFHEASRGPWLWLDDLRADLRYAFRSLRVRPAFAAAVIATLALGIGANTAIFSVVDTVLLRPLPYPDGDRLMAIHERLPSSSSPETPVAPIRVDEWSRATRSFSALAGYYTEPQSETSGALPEKIIWAVVSPRFFSVWNVAPELGRTFTPEEEGSPTTAVVVLSARLWRQRFGEQRSLADKSIRIGRSLYAVVGVMPHSFVSPGGAIDVWIPAHFPAQVFQNRRSRFYEAAGRLRPGVNPETAQAELATLYRQAAAQFPETDRGWTVTVDPLKDRTVAGVSRSLWILLAAVSLLLLIACANVYSLLLAQGRARAPEIAVRVSLGAPRSRLIAQLLTETLLLAVAGAAGGFALAYAGISFFQQTAINLPRAAELRLDGRILAFTLGLAIVTALSSGLWPALRAATNTQAGGRAIVQSRQRGQGLLTAAQVALTLVLLTGCGLMLRTLANISKVDPGFRPEQVTALRVSASWGETNNLPLVKARLERTLSALETIPGVQGAALAAHLPGTGAVLESSLVLDRDPTRKLSGGNRLVSPRYFEVLGLPLLEGRTCRDGEQNKAIVNHRLAKRYSPDRSLLGRQIRGDAPGARDWEIVGVAADAREGGLTQEPAPLVYWCGVPGFYPDPHYFVRTTDAGIAGAIRRTIREVSPSRSVFDIQPLPGHISGAGAERRFQTILLTAFALTALALAAIGIYGLMNYFVCQRTREFGLRTALGAQPAQVMALVLRHGALTVGAGVTLGLVLASAASRLIGSLLFGVEPGDAPTLAACAAVLAAISLAAAAGPAYRATRVDPLKAMREE